MRQAHGDLRKKVPGKTHAFSPSQVETFPINTAFLIHNFSFRTGAVPEEGDFRSHKGVLSSPIFYRVCYYLFVSCFYLPCVTN